MKTRSRISAVANEKRRAKREKRPHEGVYARLSPSRIHGVGVKAIRRIPKGMSIFPDDDEEITWIAEDEIQKVPSELRRLYRDFCIVDARKREYGCPRSFNHLTVAWYLNRPKLGRKPNVGCRRNYTFYALCDIKPGEELTVDYATYSAPSRI